MGDKMEQAHTEKASAERSNNIKADNVKADDAKTDRVTADNAKANKISGKHSRCVIGYVGTDDLDRMRESDVRDLDVINIAFAHIEDGKVVWARKDGRRLIDRLRMIRPSLKVMLSVGGWGADGFSRAARTDASRRKFAESAIDVMRSNGLDGIDIDWEYPGMSLAGIASDVRDGENYVRLLKMLRETIDREKEDGRLTTAVGGDSYYTRLTDMSQVAQYVDAILLMTYDLQGGFQTVTGHHAALYASGCNLMDACVDKAVRCFVQAGVEREKLVIGIPFYSRQWQGVRQVTSDGRLHRGLGMEAATVGGYGADYGELMERYIGKNGYARYWDEEACVPYLFDGSTFISYEDESSIQEKIRYVKEQGLAGIMFWEYKCDPAGRLIPFIRRTMDEQGSV